MTKFVTAIALAIALPAAAHAQTAPPAVKMDCCEKMKAAGKDCCKDMAGMDHSKMDHSKMGHGTQQSAPQPQTDQNQTHQH